MDMMDSIGYVKEYDKEVGEAMDAELARQADVNVLMLLKI